MITEPLFSNFDPDWKPLSAGSHLFAAFDQQGEHLALASAYADAHFDHVPLFHFAGPKRPTKKEVKEGKIQRPITREQLRGFARRVKATVGDQPAYVDVYGTQLGKEIKRYAKRTDPDRPIPELFDACQREGIRFVPVIDVLNPKLYREPVKSAIKEYGRGAAFRLKLNGRLMRPDKSLEVILANEIEQMETKFEGIDLVLDLGFLPLDSELRADHYIKIVDRVEKMGSWRSLSMLGSSIPAMMTDVPHGQVRKLVRHEYNLWRELRELGKKTLILGDYGVQHPSPPLEKMGPGGYASVRYSVDEYTLVSRGFEPLLESDMHEQYRSCCDHLVGHRLFKSDQETSADVEIEACSKDGVCSINQRVWRRIGTQRHLLVIRSQIT